MIQSDTLSRRPDPCPENNNDNEDIIILPDDLFLNLIDLELQKKIAISDDLDGNAAEALKLLLETAPNDNRTRRLDNGQSRWTEYSILQGKELYSEKYRLTTRNHQDLP